MNRFRFCLACAFVLAAAGFNAHAETRSALTFKSADAATEIPATLIKPDGDGPFPAVVIVHDCSGLGLRSSGAPERWAGTLVAHGYVVLIPDSFSPRGYGDGVCTVPGGAAQVVGPIIRARDAYGALGALRALPYVDGKRIGIMGGSHGGSTTLATVVAPAGERDPLFEAKKNGFAAAVALYPGCGARYGEWSVTRAGNRPGPITDYAGVYRPLAPLLILIGEKDDWTPAEPCRRMVETSRAAGYPLEINVYADAHHSFDNSNPVRFVGQRNNANSPSGRGATTGGNPEAWADALKRVPAFFAIASETTIGAAVDCAELLGSEFIRKQPGESRHARTHTSSDAGRHGRGSDRRNRSTDNLFAGACSRAADRQTGTGSLPLQTRRLRGHRCYRRQEPGSGHGQFCFECDHG